MDLSAVLSGSHSSLPSEWEVLGLSPSSSLISGSPAMCGHSSWSDTLRHGSFNLYCESVKVLVTQWCPTLCNPMYSLSGFARLLCPQNSPSKNTGVGSLSLLQGTFPTQGSNPGLLQCRQILYHLSHQGNQNWIIPKKKSVLSLLRNWF